MAIYVGADGVKTPTAIYVGAGGVKTVSAVYVGVGSVKQVWPAYTDGDELFDTEEFYYWECNSNQGSGSWEQRDNVSGPYWQFRTGAPISGNGWYAASTTQISASSLKYLYVTATGGYYTSSGTSCEVRVYLYASIASSRSNLITSDSGVGSYGTVTVYTYSSTGNQMYNRTNISFNINLTGCTRTGYLKIGWMYDSRSSASWSGSYGGCRVTAITCYDSAQSSSRTLTVT